MHALIQNDTIAHVGSLPRIWWDGDRWHDLRDDSAYAASLGWLPVTHQPRPDDTHTTTWDRDEPVLVDGLPVIGWTERAKTEAELAAEAEQNARLDDLAARVARIEAHLWPPDPDPGTGTTPEARTWAEHGGVWPHGTLLDDAGTIWRNIAKVPLTEPPSRFPGSPDQWTHLFERVTTDTQPATEHPAWDPDTSYAAGDRVVHAGHVWECLLGHGPERQGTWAPGVAHTIWADQGPA